VITLVAQAGGRTRLLHVPYQLAPHALDELAAQLLTPG
jgi:hypothetical protein